MELARVLGSNYPYKTYVPVYDGTILAEGELLIRSSAMHQAATKYYLTGYAGSSAEGDDALGITCASSTASYASKENTLQFNLASAVPSKTASTGLNFMEAIVNPDACYFAFYDQADAVSHTHAEAGTAITITSIEDHLDGGWIYSTDGTDSSATNAGQLRYITADDGTDLTVDSTYICATTSDFIKILPIGHRFVGLNAEATGITSAAAASSTVTLENRENWISGPAFGGRKLMRYWNHKGLDGLGGKDVKIEGEIIMLRHCWKDIVG